MIKDVYRNSRVVNSGKYLTTVNELTDQIPALRPKVLWEAALEIVKAGNFNCDKLVCEEDKGAPLGTTVSLITGLPLAMARWYSYSLPEEVTTKIECEYYNGNLYLNGVESKDKITIIDDTISTGGTIISLINALKQKDVEIVDIIALVEKINSNGVERVYKETGIKVKTIMKIKVDDNKVHVVE